MRLSPLFGQSVYKLKQLPLTFTIPIIDYFANLVVGYVFPRLLLLIRSFGEELLPDLGMEQDQDREQFQSSRKHVDHQQKLGRCGEEGKIPGRSHHGKSGTDIVEGRSHRRKVRYQIVFVQ